jgi:hypothetical protein
MLLDVGHVTPHLFQQRCGAELAVLPANRLALAMQSVEQRALGYWLQLESRAQLVDRRRDTFSGVVAEAEFTIVEAESLAEQPAVELVRPGSAVLPARDPRLQGFPPGQLRVSASGDPLQLADQL